MKNSISVKIRQPFNALVGQTVYTNQERRGIFTKRVNGDYQQQLGTGQTPTFSTAAQLSAFVRKHF